MASTTDSLAASPAFTFSASTFQKLHPTEYFRKFISQGVRPDGRLLDSFRPTTVHYGVITTANGSAMVRIGGTTVVCGIKAEVAEPKLDSPDQGYLVPNVDLSPICSSAFRPGSPSEQAQVVSEAIHRVLKESKVLDLKDLCIEEAKAVWALWIDVVCVSYDGNIYDAALISVMAALLNVRIRKPTYDEGIVKVPGGEAINDENSFKLNLTRIPLSTSFVLFDTDLTLLADPNFAEESITQGQISVTIDEHGRLCRISKVGAASTSQSLLKQCIERAKIRSHELRSIMNQQ
ncbi:Exosome complex component RRP43 [Lobosporangium transversale]|uniref:Ribosomal RNA-processing protein 43 n=1 Tax=Lobosporangium transversale TaxID=64571 RepID=A0A1Y2GSJ4_9FUNG|nr:ribosomal protein S5 domain 2-type protein [Lobosporangium transversale]KAF9916913.1 Exosome complex component RRP43 [Lobosporangium transversale]ORZ21750.1 ribosomal protein S5 domain 2-type protein [Lobosporangium transversale]|eukprot:XP_021883001.1 ribosomal protein S5 domain 2-type protein [Lobosporangium transversale]